MESAPADTTSGQPFSVAKRLRLSSEHMGGDAGSGFMFPQTSLIEETGRRGRGGEEWAKEEEEKEGREGGEPEMKRVA